MNVNVPPAEKRCTRCGVVKPLDAFHRHPTSRFGRRPDCAECHNADSRARRDPMRQRTVARARLRALSRLAGLHRDEFERLLAVEREREGLAS